ncbi:AAA family ATPase [Gimesia sp.]|uniref:AAA family ATPase n=1 Tax=Gimesia sp. TaxID=2024833 RepID=UPI0025C4FF21|nr:AAA family ATPase [Gimesia sp.]|tara:strand:+ start:2330 stop:4120 length:1791 start_codon:yes stop_codon:yes gene_type:complete
MSNAKKLESMLEFLCNDVYEAISSDIDEALEHTAPGQFANRISALLQLAIEVEGEQLKSVINAAAICDVLFILRRSILTDELVDDSELLVAAELMKYSLHRFSFMEEYKPYLYGCDAEEFRELLIQWESDKSWLGGAILDGAVLEPFRLLVMIACVIKKSPELFQSYSKILLLTAKLILNANGIQKEDQTFFTELCNDLRELEESFCEHLDVMTELQKLKRTDEVDSVSDAPNQITPEESLKQGLQELNALIGLDAVKAEVTRMANFLNIRRQRQAQGMPVASQTLHFVFTGNPGTGKTTVARIIAKILYGYQILRTPNFLEADRATMVGGYVGQTAIKTNEVIAKSTDGVLFIDEAYTLAKSSGQDYGQEAIDTLLKKMEDLRQRLVVIVAGYLVEMAEFIESNPGLESRFSRYIVFEDYHVSDLCQIFEMMCNANTYQLTPAARGNLAILLNRVFTDRDQNFGNARLVRNAYERTLGNHADRLSMSTEPITRESLSTIEAVDLPFRIAKGMAGPVDLKTSRWRVNCPHCENTTTASLPFLGQIVKCNACSTRFRCPWWNLDRSSVPGLNGFELYERPGDLDGYDIQAEEATAKS